MTDDDKVVPFPVDVAEAIGSFFRCYKLVNRTPIPATNPVEWANELLRRRRSATDPWRVAETTIGDVTISTVFLGLDHRFSGHGPPVLFETMIFGGKLDQQQDRCCTWEEAEKMHEDAVRQVRGGHLRVVK